jgi:hypothetical protein
MQHNYNGVGMGDKFRVRQLVMIETNGNAPQYRRPYETVVTPDVEMMVHDRIDPQQSVTAANLAGIANRFILPSATYEKEVGIAHGWGTRRLRFMLLLDHIGPAGVEITQIITGYSEFFDPSLQGSVDPDMCFYVNSTMSLRRLVARTGTGNREYYNVADNAHIIVDNHFDGIHQPEKEYRMRPADVYSTMTRIGLGQQNLDMNDTRTLITGMPQKSWRANANTTAYAASLFENYKTAMKLDALGQSEDQILSQARGTAAEQSVSQDAFMAAINRMRGSQGNVFTLRDLTRLDQHALDDDIAILTMQGQASAMNPYGHGGFFHNQSTEVGWQAANQYTQIATILGHSIPAIMVDNAIAKIIVHMSNRNEFRQGEVVVSQMLDFPAMAGTTIDMSQFVERFKWRVVHEVLNDLSFDNQIDYLFNMQIDLLGESIIEVSMNGGEFETFVLPSFCDALLIPIVTNNDQRSLQLASDFDSLFTAALSPNNVDPSGSYHGTPGGSTWGNL